jgi:gamma-glutamyltranspeptidase / glutathione hydrolase
MSVVHASHGHHYAVTAGHELAALAAFEVLENGGNAVDAGVAGILTLGVVYSDQVSIAGVAPMVIYSAETGQAITIAGVGGWPRALDADAYVSRHGGEIALGIERTVVPAAPDACLQALERFGTMTYRDVATRAIKYAAHGFPRHQVMLDYVTQYANDYRQFPDNAALWLPNDEVPAAGSRLVQSDLGRTLQFLCDEEAAAGGDRRHGLDAVRKAFYQGDIATAIVAHQRDNGGILDAQDLKDFRCQTLPTVARDYRFNGETVEIHTCGAWSQGPTLHAALSMLEGVDVAALEFGSSAYYHAVAEALKLAFADRDAYLGDPDFVDVPVEAWLSEEYAHAQRARIDPRRASPGMPAPGNIPGFTPFLSPVIRDHDALRLPADTSIVAAVDSAGNAFVATPSDTSWDTPIVPGTGLAVSSRGAQSWAVPGHPSVLAPGKRPRLTPNPCFARVDGRWVMPFGTPGGDAQVQANTQFLLANLAFGMPVQDAIEAPRVMTHSHPDSFAPHAAHPGKVTAESRIAPEITDELSERGHEVERIAEWTHSTGGMCAIRYSVEDSEFVSGADPRRISKAMAW